MNCYLPKRSPLVRLFLRVAPTVVVVVLGVSLSSCSFSIGAAAGARQYYVLNELPGTVPIVSRIPARIAVRRSEANRFIDSHKILFTDNPSVLSYYQFASWVETPAEYLTLILTRKLETVGVFQSVSHDQETPSEYILESTILDFYHDTKSKPGNVQVKVAAELYDGSSQAMVTKREFTKDTPVESYDAAGAVAGLEKALNEIIDEMIVWLAESTTRK